MADENKWTVEYYNDTGTNDESFWEWWEVSDGDRIFKCDDNLSSEWLCEVLNGLST